MPNRRPSTLAALLFALATLAIAGLLFIPRTPAIAPSGPAVSATVFPLYDIVRNVAGPEVRVTLLLPPGTEPHAFDPTPSTIAGVSDSAVIYAIGHGLDTWADGIAAAAGTRTVIVDRGIALRAAPEADATGQDPHYWLTVPNAKRIAATVADDLSRRFPDRAATFRSNLATYGNSLDALDAEIRSTLAAPANRRLVTFHDAWYYFGAEYGLDIVGTFEPTPGREPSPRQLAALLEVVETDGVRTIYSEPLFSDAVIEAFAADNGLRIAALDDIGGTPGREDYISLMRANAKAINDNQ